MSVYSDFDYDEQSQNYNIERQSGDGISIQPSSVDLHLGNEFAIPYHKARPVRVDDEETYPEYAFFERERIIIEPGSFLLASTDEIVWLSNNVVGQVHGRSSVGRLGLFIHNAGLIDAGFEGDITLELFNPAPYPIELVAGMRICQMTLNEHASPALVDYSSTGKYQDQSGPTPSKLFKDF